MMNAPAPALFWRQRIPIPERIADSKMGLDGGHAQVQLSVAVDGRRGLGAQSGDLRTGRHRAVDFVQPDLHVALALARFACLAELLKRQRLEEMQVRPA